MREIINHLEDIFLEITLITGIIYDNKMDYYRDRHQFVSENLQSMGVKHEQSN